MPQPSDSTQSEPGYMYERHPNEPPSKAVIVAVAKATDQSPLEIEPLAEVIDPDALDALLGTDKKAPSMAFTFEYCGRQVTVTPSEIQIDP
ncbi:HalOD1 output domain-containing protein [Haladaptatus salinisoli]|uniref:HalOD1 output domain-containing protein n=1 Tax=Haladaptatus salinisoli TaxID=2884876 RepID=UPI001D0AF103|nr:HalOD1 output domain-containing protein [Haladaptatus salinisoli]